jgi:predicted amidohydrolase YtcJ
MAARLTAYVVVAIVAATLIAGLIVGAQRDDNDGPVDLIVTNATVYTADRRGTTAEAVAVRGNQILRVGSNREIVRLQRPQTVVVNAGGGVVVPGFNDAHVDLIAGGLELTAIDLAGADTADDIIDRVKSWSEANPAAPWVIGKGWTPEHFKGGLPTRRMLDRVVPDRPAVFHGADAGTPAVWVNSRALKLAGITRTTRDPRGVITREGRSGEPAGVQRGTVAAIIAAQVPRPSPEDRLQALRLAITEANAHGVTSAQNTASSCEDDLDLFDSVRRAGEMTLRVYCAAAVDPSQIKTESDLAPLNDLRVRYPDDPVFKTGALAFTVDGPLEQRQAALLDVYADDQTAAPALVDPDQLNRAIRLADAAGWQVVTEANGDGAVRLALNAYAHAIRSNRAPARGRRHRIEQLALVDAADGLRFGPLGVAASLQPPLITTDAFASLVQTLGPDRAERVYPVTELAQHTRLLLGSGWRGADEESLDPLQVLDRAVNGVPPESAGGDTGAEPPAKIAGLKIKAAIDAYTSTAAWGSFDDQRKGTISQGMLADLVVLSEDVLTTPSKLKSAAVVATIFDGKIVYQRDSHALTAPAPSLQH